MSRLAPYIKKLVCLALCLALGVLPGISQPVLKNYKIKQGRMIIELDKRINEPSLDSFIRQYDLNDIGLKSFILNGIRDTLIKQGWQQEFSDDKVIVLSKSLEMLEDLKHPGDKFVFHDPKKEAYFFPATGTNIVMGYNRFRNKQPFRIEDSVVTFFLKGNQRASRVLLAASFTQWKRGAVPMQKTDSGWIVQQRLSAGKYWYKFIIDEEWQVDADNQLKENDGRGNINSVYYQPNHTIRLDGFANARRVMVAGSFNDWKDNELALRKTGTGWELPLYLAEGTYTYRFIVDGRWMADPGNPQKAPNEFGEYNSIIQKGKTFLFTLKGYTNGSKVYLSGTFNDWRGFEWPMQKTDSGWVLPYVLGEGNYQYRFVVDGKRLADPANPLKVGNDRSVLILNPNYTFRLKGASTAKKVYLAGDFNDWSPNAFLMQKDGDDWVFTVNLQPGKHRYKYVVDGKWTLDPNNPLWEQNEHHTGNSILWVEEASQVYRTP